MVEEFLTYFLSLEIATSALENVFKWISVMLSTDSSVKAFAMKKKNRKIVQYAR